MYDPSMDEWMGRVKQFLEQTADSETAIQVDPCNPSFLSVNIASGNITYIVMELYAKFGALVFIDSNPGQGQYTIRKRKGNDEYIGLEDNNTISETVINFMFYFIITVIIALLMGVIAMYLPVPFIKSYIHNITK